MKKGCVFAAAATVFLLSAAQQIGVAETSTNLQVERELTYYDKVTRLTYLDQNGNPAIADDLGYATVCYTYGSNHQVVRAEYFDVNGNPIDNADGYQLCVQSWSGMNKLIEQAYYNVAGDLAIGPDGYARQVNTYDEGRLLETLQYGADGELLRSDETFARYTATYFVNKYDKHKKEKEEYFDADGQLLNFKDGYASAHYEYIAETHLCKTTYRDANGEPVMHAALGYAR